MDFSISVVIQFLSSIMFWVFLPVHTIISILRNLALLPGEHRILLHVCAISHILTAADYLRRRGFSQKAKYGSKIN